MVSLTMLIRSTAIKWPRWALTCLSRWYARRDLRTRWETSNRWQSLQVRSTSRCSTIQKIMSTLSRKMTMISMNLVKHQIFKMSALWYSRVKLSPKPVWPLIRPTWPPINSSHQLLMMEFSASSTIRSSKKSSPVYSWRWGVSWRKWGRATRTN